MRVVEVEVGRTRDLRARVLRPGVPLDQVGFPGDDGPGTVHLAAEDDEGAVVGIVTLIPDGDRSVRLRSMAVDPALQGGGVGRLLVDAAVERLRAAGMQRVWCNARDTAIGFYERLGWTVTGPGFIEDVTGLPHHPMELLL
jgi:ribosomal protein S18 acetylase RimI-like enzyme